MESPGETFNTQTRLLSEYLNTVSMFFVQVDHQLMCLSSLDVTGDGSPEVVSVDQSETIICDCQSEPCILG